MVVNTDKTELIAFGPGKIPKLCFVLQGNEIQSVEDIRVLGIRFDSKMKWNVHISNIEKTIKSKIHALRKIKKYYKEEELLTLAHGQIYSTMYYASGAWLTPSISKLLVQRLTKLSNATLRVIFQKRQDEIGTSELHSLGNLLTPWQNSFYGPTKLFHSIMHNEQPLQLYKEILLQTHYHPRTKQWTTNQ